MNLLKYINGVLFIDDKKDDVSKLYSYFEKNNIPCMYINPNNYNGEVDDTIGFARFVFLDIEFMSGTPNLVDVVSLLRSLSEKGMKNVVLIMWTLHEDYIAELTSLINKKMKKEKPILIFNAQKKEFIGLKDEQYCDKLEKLFSESIEKEPLVYKMLEWEKCANIATYKTFNDIIEMSYQDDSETFDLLKALSNMASQNIPNNKISSSFDTANNMLVDKIKCEVELIEDIDLLPNEDSQFLRKMNYYMMFFSTGLRKIHPGNIYSVEQLQNRFKETIDKENIDKKKIDSILVDLTPGCSFAHSNFLILLEGIIVKNVSPNEQKTINNLFASESFLKDIYIDNNNQLNYLIIDYMSILTIKKEELDYDPIMCLKENYRMNIQQQFGHYLARIGDNIYHSKKKEKNF